MSKSVKNKIGSQDWYYHAPNKFEPCLGQVAPAISQVPDLCTMVAKDTTTGDQQYKRGWIKESDSDYIKMAKSGGRTDLFRYRVNKPKGEPMAYPRVDWFDHDEIPNNVNTRPKSNVKYSSGWFGHDEHVKSEKDVMLTSHQRPLFGVDSKSTWTRDDDKLPGIRNKSKKSKSVQQTKEMTNLPQIQKQSIDNGNMVGLLSFQYQKDFIDESQTRSENRKHQLMKEKRLLLEKQQKDMGLDRMKKKPEDETEKPMFKMSKFKSVTSKVDTKR